jgi:xylan 1,4-beta-xylosidase
MKLLSAAIHLATLFCVQAISYCADEQAASPTYANPIITAGSPADPHVIRVDDTYYLYATTHGRGYDVLTSKDLVHWEEQGRAFDDPRGGAWAPDVFHNVNGDGKFYLYYTDNDLAHDSGPERKQIGVAVADSPLGPFVDKKVLAPGSIDAHLFQDDDGQLYLYYVEIIDGFKIFGQRMSDPLTPVGERVELIHPTEPWEMASGHVTEGPFVLKRDGVYYLMFSGSGADSRHYAIGYATSKSPLGPFEKYAKNPIVGPSEKIHGPGHHCVVTGPDGKLWMVYHQKWNAGVNWRRFLAIDPIWFDEAGVLQGKLSRDSEEPGPIAK